MNMLERTMDALRLRYPHHAVSDDGLVRRDAQIILLAALDPEDEDVRTLFLHVIQNYAPDPAGARDAIEAVRIHIVGQGGKW